MRTRSLNKWLFRLGIILIVVLTLIAESGVTLAIGGQVMSINIAFDQEFPSIGQTPLLSIDVSNTGDQPVVITQFFCTLYGNSVTYNSINPIPSEIPAHSDFHAHQLYRANTAGHTTITCSIGGYGKLSNTAVGVTSSPNGVTVQPDIGLYIYASSGTHIATVGQAIYIDIRAGNRSKALFQITNLFCNQTAGPIIPLQLQTVPPSNTLSPGQIDFIQYRGFAAEKGNLSFQCFIEATDSHGVAYRRYASVINITVK